MGASTKEELKHKTKQILKKIDEADMSKNKDKYERNFDKILYLGYQISQDGISPDEKLTKKIAKMSTPKNQKELESFLGQTNFL